MTRQETKQNGQPTAARQFWWRSQEDGTCQTKTPLAGDLCPECGHGYLAYDGLFVLACKKCGKVAEAGAFT